MNWFEKDGKELAELIYSELLESDNGFLSFNNVMDIVDSNPNYGLNKTLHFASKYIGENQNIERIKDGKDIGGMRLINQGVK